MNPPHSPTRLPFNSLFGALWIGMIASNLGSWLYASGASTALSSTSTAQLPVLVVNMSTSLPMCGLALLSVVVSLYLQRHVHQQFAFRKMGSQTIAVSILTFLGFAGPWVILCTAFVLGLCAAIGTLSVQPVLLELLSKTFLPKSLALSTLGTNLGRTAWNVACGVLATVAGPAAIFVLSAISVCLAFMAGRTSSSRGAGAAQPS